MFKNIVQLALRVNYLEIKLLKFTKNVFKSNNVIYPVHSHACPKIGQLEVTMFIQQHVVWFYVPIKENQLWICDVIFSATSSLSYQRNMMTSPRYALKINLHSVLDITVVQSDSLVWSMIDILSTFCIIVKHQGPVVQVLAKLIQD